MSESLPASVIIPTRNRADVLARCLESLSRDSSATVAEVVVVDNGSTDGTEAVVTAAASRSPRPLRLVREPRPGVANARNTGVRATSGELLLYLDDDVVVHDGWIDAMVAGFQPGVLAVQGRLIPTFPAGRPAWVDANRGALSHQPNFLTFADHGDASFIMAGDETAHGAAMGLRRAAIPDPSQPFRVELGSSVGLHVGGSDGYMLWQLHQRGTVFYTADAVVEHPFDDPARLSRRFGRRRSYLAGLSCQRFQLLTRAPAAHTARRRGVADVVRGVADVLGATRYVITVRLRHALRDPDGAATWQEFSAYWSLGRYLERLHPRLAAVVARLLR